MNFLDEINRLLPQCLLKDQHRIERELLAISARPRGDATRPSRLDRLHQRALHSSQSRQQRRASLPRIHYPPDLPITARRPEILNAIRRHQVVIIAGETGSGKTTQLPKMCLEAGLGVAGRIGCTQPRRVAALSLSKRIASELKVSWGRQVGAKIRFNDRSSDATLIKMMTDGMLLAETQADRDLRDYEAIIIDEAHERSLNIDFLLGYLKTLLPRRPELKLIVTSATIDTEAFSRAFDGAPVLEVSGRLYPVDIHYAPHDPEAEDRGDLTYIDAAIRAVRDVLDESAAGDILVFMPGERDIRETMEGLRGSCPGNSEILPMFGRLSAGEQERIFASSDRRKIIVATNIAETSLTIPGIHYVIDPGLVRMSRYSPRTRTRRLPIEPISQSSANQRAGRAGRLEHGVCIRLYSEEEFAERPPFTQPEIQRCNLADVILRMKAFQLGDIETFPFLNPPVPAAIQSGYHLLHELGALDAERRLTPLGRKLARLPVDPSIGRMVLQSVREHALEDVLVIAAALSIQDPRERPWDRHTEADHAHRRFLHPNSDFLTLANIWRAYHDTWESLRTQNQLRKFCRTHFLSYARMREWRDIHAQLRETLKDLSEPTERPGPGNRARTVSAPADPSTPPQPGALNPTAIHRSILSGLLGHIAHRTGPNQYRASANREVMVFPGSCLFDRAASRARAKRKSTAPDSGEPQAKVSQPEWVVAGELVETNRLYLRTLAHVDPDWIVELSDHICRRAYLEPHWDRRAGRVLARERITLFGLLIRETWIDYGRIQPGDATDLFVRSALVENDMDSSLPCLEHNRQLHQRIQMGRSRSRDVALPDLDQALFRFYRSQLEGISSIHDLHRAVKEQSRNQPGFLVATEADLAGESSLDWDEASFPRTVSVAGQSVTVDYAYAPGEPQDGATVRVPAALAHRMEPDMLDWIIPGLRREQIMHLVKGMPKAQRIRLMPLAPKVKTLAETLGPGLSIDTLHALLRDRHGLDLPAESLRRESLPDYLRVRVAIVGPKGTVVAEGRDLTALKRGLQSHETPAEKKAWSAAVARWERYDLTGWTFEDPPPSLEVTSVSGTPFMAYPGLTCDEGAVHLKLFHQQADALHASRDGWVGLAERALQKELAWLKRDLHSMTEEQKLYATRGSREEFLETAYGNLRRHLLNPPPDGWPLRKVCFEASLKRTRDTLPEVMRHFAMRVSEILNLRQQLQVLQKPYPGMAADVEALLPPRFLSILSHARLERVPRYLMAMKVRSERAATNPDKDREKSERIHPYLQALAHWHGAGLQRLPARHLYEQIYWLIQEFKVSIFAQELGTAEPVSAKRLDALLETLRREAG